MEASGLWVANDDGTQLVRARDIAESPGWTWVPRKDGHPRSNRAEARGVHAPRQAQGQSNTTTAPGISSRLSACTSGCSSA
jgi:hypothetical protein